MKTLSKPHQCRGNLNIDIISKSEVAMMVKKYSDTYLSIKYAKYFKVGDERREILLRTKFESKEWDRVTLQ